MDLGLSSAEIVTLIDLAQQPMNSRMPCADQKCACIAGVRPLQWGQPIRQ
jgi:hypothetical protein